MAAIIAPAAETAIVHAADDSAHCRKPNIRRAAVDRGPEVIGLDDDRLWRLHSDAHP